MGLSQTELAEKVHVTQNYIAMMESGAREVSELQSLKLLDLFVEAARSSDPVFEVMRSILRGEKPEV